MFDYLKQHAAANVWCSPEQDNQVILAAQRITKPVGELIAFTLMGRRLPLPTSDRRYHVFQIGQAHPSILGLLPKNPVWADAAWINFRDALNALPLFIDLYTDKGLHFPLHRSYYQYSTDRALIFAVPIDSVIPVDYVNDRVYLRLYTNAYFDSGAAQGLSPRTSTDGKTLLNTNELLAFQSQVAVMKAKPGMTFCYVNGQLVDTISPLTAGLGDIVEYVYDSSIKRVVDLVVETLPTFVSDLDSCQKYLVHYPDTGDQVIDYVDDIDVYVTLPVQNKTVGRYYHRNLAKSLRMVTHRDYSLPVELYENLAQAVVDANSPVPVDLRSLTLKVIIRRSGLTRPLIKEASRLFELYKLPDALVLETMVGVNATVPHWRAEALEANAYTELMRIPLKDITIELIEQAYGYNSLTQVLADSPLRPKAWGQSKVVPLPVELQSNSTFYEYDSDGLLLGTYTQPSGQYYYPVFPSTAMVEGIVGLGSRTASAWTGTDNLLIPTIDGYRVYMCYVENGQPNHKWKDITDSDYYTVENGLLKWSGLDTDQFLMVRSDQRFLAYGFDLAPNHGVLQFDLTETLEGLNVLMTVPMGDLDIWLNKRSLIRGLDYTVNFPKVTIFNKVYLKQPVMGTPQRIDVRFTGFAEKDLSLDAVEDYGFIEHGFLSNNFRFDLRDDKVLRITVGGSVKHRDEVLFSEEHSGVSILNALNGVPYQVKDVTVPMRTWTAQRTKALKEQALIIDKLTRDYMTLKLPQPPRDALNAIIQRHVLFSPFFSKVISDLKGQFFDEATLQKNLTDNEVLALCKPYEPLLAVDPISPGLQMDSRYVVIHPTLVNDTVDLNLYQYRFLQKVVRLYGRNQISLTPYLNVSLGA